jgi:hypothetical protein
VEPCIVMAKTIRGGQGPSHSQLSQWEIFCLKSGIVPPLCFFVPQASIVVTFGEVCEMHRYSACDHRHN